MVFLIGLAACTCLIDIRDLLLAACGLISIVVIVPGCLGVEVDLDIDVALVSDLPASLLRCPFQL